MDNDDLSRLKRHLDAPWDEVREQRVLTQIQRALREPAPRRRPVLVSAMAAVAIVAVVAGIFVAWKRSPSVDTASVVPSGSPSSTASGASAMTMALADGSRALFVQDADVQVEEQRPQAVRLHQRRGTVAYEVRHDPAREFSVRAGGSLVRVRGTKFIVALSIDAVEVTVSEGHVELDDGARTHELTKGQSLRVPVQDETTPVPAPPTSEQVPPPVTSDRPSPSRAPSVAELQARADAARLQGRPDEAASALETLVSTHPRDASVPSALFSLGRVELARHRDLAAARAFERCLKAAPSGPLAEDALAEAAAARSSGGDVAGARRHASEYLSRYPDGAHRARMRGLLGS